LIEFNPIKASLVAIPEGIAFVAANSLTEVPKFVSLAHCYNKRVVECRLATILLCKHFGITEQLSTLREVKEHVNLGTSELVKIVDDVLQDTYTTESIEQALQDTLSNTLNTIPYFDVVINKNNEYKPKQRAMHVY